MGGGEDRSARKRSRSPTERKSNKERDETKGERQSRSDRNTDKDRRRSRSRDRNNDKERRRSRSRDRDDDRRRRKSPNGSSGKRSKSEKTEVKTEEDDEADLSPEEAKRNGGTALGAITSHRTGQT